MNLDHHHPTNTNVRLQNAYASNEKPEEDCNRLKPRTRKAWTFQNAKVNELKFSSFDLKAADDIIKKPTYKKPKKNKPDFKSSDKGVSFLFKLFLFGLLVLALATTRRSFEKVQVLPKESEQIADAVSPPVADHVTDKPAEKVNTSSSNENDVLVDMAPSSFLLPPKVDRDARKSLALLTRRIRKKTPRVHRDPFYNCSVTSQVQIERYDTHWVLQAIDTRGNYKTTGGDEFYATYTEASSTAENQLKNATTANPAMPAAVARITDQQNGRYRLDFVTVPMSNHISNDTEEDLDSAFGTLTVQFQYSCGIGRIPQPVKNNWPTGGSTSMSFSVPNVPRPHWRIFKPPTGIDLSSFDVVISFGDSLMGRFAGYTHHRENIFWTGNIRKEISKETLARVLRKLESSHGKRLRRQDQSVALVLGSAMWDLLEAHNIQGTDFSDHLHACRDLITAIRRIYPSVSIFWKSPSAAHRHRAICNDNRACQYRLRYLSTSRVEFLYEQQTTLMRELNVPVLDIYEGTYLSAHWTLENDVMHYQLRFDQEIIRWFYNDTFPSHV